MSLRLSEINKVNFRDLLICYAKVINIDSDLVKTTLTPVTKPYEIKVRYQFYSTTAIEYNF